IILALFMIGLTLPQISLAADVQSTSKLGRLDGANVTIYSELSNNASTSKAGSTYTDRVLYIKQQANWNGELYYRISLEARSGVIGWVKASDIWAQNHVGVDNRQKTFYLKGTGWAYTDAWGASKDVVYRNLSLYKDQEFKVNLTEKVGNYIWYRGTIDGKTVWVQSYNVLNQPTGKVNSTSKLGRIQNVNAQIYESYNSTANSKTAGT